MKTILALITVLPLSVSLAGCAGQHGSLTADQQAQEEYIDEPTIKHIVPNMTEASVRTTRAPRAELAARNATGLAPGLLADVLFDFDQASLRHDAWPSLATNAKRLRETGVRTIVLEGRGDEFGTAAYNLVLADRRAKRVKEYLQDYGLAAELRTTSYGKDRPLCLQHTSECWQRNRSVHFVVAP